MLLEELKGGLMTMAGRRDAGRNASKDRQLNNLHRRIRQVLKEARQNISHAEQSAAQAVAIASSRPSVHARATAHRALAQVLLAQVMLLSAQDSHAVAQALGSTPANHTARVQGERVAVLARVEETCHGALNALAAAQEDRGALVGSLKDMLQQATMLSKVRAC